MGGGSGSNTTTVEKIPPWLEGAYRDLTGRATMALDNVSQEPFQGQFNALPNPAQYRGLQYLQGVGRDVGRSGAGQELFDLAQGTIRGDFLSPESNPYLQENVDIINTSVNRERDKALSDLNTAFTASGGAALRNAFESGEVRRNADEIRGNAVSQLLLDNYQLERGLQQNAPNLLQSAIGTLDFPGARSIEVGQGSQALEQMILDEALAQFTESNEAPLRGLGSVAQILGLINGGGTISTDASGQGPSTFQGALGGASAGASIGTAASPGYGTLIGAILGALGGGLASR